MMRSIRYTLFVGCLLMAISTSGQSQKMKLGTTQKAGQVSEKDSSGERMAVYKSDFNLPAEAFASKLKSYTSLNSATLLNNEIDKNFFDLSRLEDRLILALGRFYYNKILASGTLDSNDVEAKLIRGFLRQAIQASAKTALITGKLESPYLKKDSLFKTVKSELPTLICEKEMPLPVDTNKGLKVIMDGPKTAWSGPEPYKKQTAGYRTYLLSEKKDFIALYKPDVLTLESVNSDQTAIIKRELRKKLVNPIYCFSKQNDVYVSDQTNPSELRRLGVNGDSTIFKLPDSLSRFSYRIDQLLPDDNLLVARRIKHGQTMVLIFDYVKKTVLYSTSLPYLVNSCRLESRLGQNQFIMAFFQVADQTYTLLKVDALSKEKSIPLGQVKEYRLQPSNEETFPRYLVGLHPDDSLSVIDIHPDKATNAKKLGVSKARYFDIKGDLLVYWQQDKNDKWTLYTYKLGEPTSVKLDFQYDTSLRRDVPRIIVDEKSKGVYFKDPFNRTYNKVALTK